MIGIFGPELVVEGTDADLFALSAALARNAAPHPELYLACGTEDALLGESRAFRQHLDALGLPCAYEESPGAHEWTYWDAQIQRVLDWLPVPEATGESPQKE
jgi:S-formylglutathione hydrolase FrmB